MRQRRSSDRYEPITDPSLNPIWRAIRVAENPEAANLEQLKEAARILEDEKPEDYRGRLHRDERLRRIRSELRARGG